MMSLHNLAIILVMIFVEEKISNPYWIYQEEATYEFGSIIEGPSPKKPTPLVNVTLKFIPNAMRDENSHVKYTNAWTLKRIFEFLHGSTIKALIIRQSNLPQILSMPLKILKDSPNVAEKVCGTFYFLARDYEDVGENSSPLSLFYKNIVEALLDAAHRGDAGKSRLQIVAYDTLNEVVHCSTKYTTAIVMQLVPVSMPMINETLEMQKLSSKHKEK